MSRPTESLLVFSDVHLGSDLNDSGKSVPRSKAIDTDLAALLAHYRKTSPPADRWHLVIAGDFVDFVGMSIDARDGDDLSTELNAGERAFGLGGAVDHVRLKLRRAVERHPDVFDELAAFVAAGNPITLVQGNHDLEMHWDQVKDDFRAVLSRSVSSDEEKQAIASRIEVLPWFFYREGVVYIEHGHQFDPFCATPYILAPLSPRDPNRVQPSLSDCLLRYIVRRTPGMKEYGHEDRGLWSYISWGLLLGVRGCASLGKRFFSVVAMLRDVARAHAGSGGAHVKKEHDTRFQELIRKTGISAERLSAALALHVQPLGRTPRGVLASVMLDRLAVFSAMIPLFLLVAIFHGALAGYALHVTGGLIALWVILHLLLSRGRPSVDPATLMGERAADLGKLFPSSFVVMGHTHVPTTKNAGTSIYINLGSWAEEEPDPSEQKPYRAARTHLVIHANAKGDKHEARLCEWRSGSGPHERTVLVN